MGALEATQQERYSLQTCSIWYFSPSFLWRLPMLNQNLLLLLTQMLTPGCIMMDTTEDTDLDTDTVMVDTCGDARRGKLMLSPLLSLLLLLMLKLTHGCTMELDTTVDSDTTDTDLVTMATAMVLEVDIFGDVRRGPLRLSPLLKLKPIPGCIMVLVATMVVTMDVVTMAVTTDSDTEDISGDKFGNQPISAITSLPCLTEQIQVTKTQNQLPTAFAEERLPCAK